MGADIHAVLEKRVLPPGLMPGNEVWLGVNAFPYVIAKVYDFSRRDRAVATALAGTEAADAAYDVEVTFEGNTHWSALTRNYDLFAALAGVRGPGPAPRGIPEDVSPLASHSIARWGEDGHSHSWMLMDEALPLFVQHHQLGDPGKAVLDAMKNGTAAALEPYMRHFWGMEEDDQLSDFRLIFWFDS